MTDVAAKVINIKKFHVDLGEKAKTWPPAIAKLYVKKVTLEALGLVLFRFPVDTGVHRANVNISVGQKDVTFNPEKKTSAKEGSKANADELATGITTLAGWQPGQTAWITSTGPGTSSMEFGLYPNPPKFGSWDKDEEKYVVKSQGGYSKQAPRGMFRIAAEEVVQSLKAKKIRVTSQEINAVTGKRIRKGA